MEVGLAFLPVAVVIAALSLGFSARLASRFGARAVLLPGLALILVGLALLIRVVVQGDYLVGSPFLDPPPHCSELSSPCSGPCS